MAKTFLDYMSEQDYARYNEILNIAAEAKANAPKPERAPRSPMTNEQKANKLMKKKAELEAKLAELLGMQ